MKKVAFWAVLLSVCVFAVSAQALTVTGLETETVGRAWETSLFFSRMEALTGVAVEAHGVTDPQEYEQMLEQMLEGEIPADVLFKANLTREQEYALLDAGAIVDLAPLIDTYMPNLSALLKENPEWRETIALEDGRIASLPLINRTERQVCVWIHTGWLEKLGLEMPTTVEELTQVLAVIRDSDANGNGEHDEIAADLTGVYEMRWLLPYFGIVADDYNLARDAQGNLVFAPELPEYRDFIALLKSWMEQGILREDAFTALHSAQALSSEEEEVAHSGILVSLVPYTQVPAEEAVQYDALLMPGPDGQTRWRDLLGEVFTGCFAVTSACQDPGQALAWVDALYAEEGAVLAYAGVEGEDYAVDAEGRWSFLTGGLRNVETIRSEVLMYTGTAMPGLYPSDFMASVNSEVDEHVMAQSERVRAVSERVTPAYALDAQAQRRADELAQTLGALVDEGIAQFVTGEVEWTDENYEAWLQTLREAGSEELVALFEGA